jgi:hypothetical protein
LAVAILALVVAVSAAVISGWQLRESRKANLVPGIVDLFREYRADEMVRARRVLVDVARYNSDAGLQGLPEEVIQAAIRVINYLNHVGILVANGLLSPALARSFLGGSASRLWRDLSPFISRERELRGRPRYARHFQDLGTALRELDSAAPLS